MPKGVTLRGWTAASRLGEALLQLAHLQQLGGGERPGEEQPAAGDGVLHGEAVEHGDLRRLRIWGTSLQALDVVGAWTAFSLRRRRPPSRRAFVRFLGVLGVLQYVEPFDLPEPDEETLESVRALYERAE